MQKRPRFGDGAALVFGGSGGIGGAICAGLAEAGSPVALTYRSNRVAAERVAGQIAAAGGTAAAFQADVTDAASVAAAIDGAMARFGQVHSVVFVAGAMPMQRYIGEYDEAAWREAIDVEVHGFYHVVRAMLPHFREQRGGAFVHLGSAADRLWANRDGLSVIPKAANEALVRGIAREEGRYGIRANSVLIGVIEAGMFLKFSEAGVFDEAWLRKTYEQLGLKRLGKAEEVADAVVFLASNRASYVTGEQISVSGGYGA